MTLLRMHAFRPEGGAAPTRASSPSKPAGAPMPPKRVASPATATATDKAVAAWPRLAQELPVTGAARELARNAELRTREDNVFDLVVPKSKAYLSERSYQEKLKAALEKHLGTPCAVKVSVGEVGGESAAAMEASDRETKRAEAAKSVQSDGFVKDLVNLFDGKVVDSTIRQTEK
jgi:DNA polymerase-3 subunit gamma/tau